MIRSLITIWLLALSSQLSAAEVWDDTGWKSEVKPHTVNQQCWVGPGGQVICAPQSQANQGGYYQQAAQQQYAQAAGAVPGPTGEPGPAGPPGPPGPSGETGPAAVVDIGEVAAQVRESFEPLRMTEIDYDTLAPKLADIIRADIHAGLLPELTGPPGQPAPPATLPSIEVIADGVAGVLGKTADTAAATPFGLTAIELALSGLGIGGGAALPIWALLSVLKAVRQSKQGRESRVESREPDNVTGPRPSALDPRPIAVDSPPTPQYRGVEQRYVTIESDRYAHAHAFAKEQLARRFPGAVNVLETEAALIDQYLAGNTKS